MAKYRRKPVIVEAQYFDGSILESERLAAWCGGQSVWASRGLCGITISTREGTVLVSPGDWIIRGFMGEFYPCKPEIFTATYDIVGPTDG